MRILISVLAYVGGVVGGLAFDCAKIDAAGKLWDISGLFPEAIKLELKIVQHETISKDQYDLYVNLCKPVGPIKDIPQNDQCPKDSLACRLITNTKDKDSRVISVADFGTGPPTVTVNSEQLVMTLTSAVSSLEFKFNCVKDQTENTPILQTLDKETNKYSIHWENKYGCSKTGGTTPPTTGNPNGGSPPPNTGGGSGVENPKPVESSFVGSLFFYIFWGFVGYSVIGIAVNYIIHQERSFPQLFPHHEFWARILQLFAVI
jgi:hypothetical protein